MQWLDQEFMQAHPEESEVPNHVAVRVDMEATGEGGHATVVVMAVIAVGIVVEILTRWISYSVDQ